MPRPSLARALPRGALLVLLVTPAAVAPAGAAGAGAAGVAIGAPAGAGAAAAVPAGAPGGVAAGVAGGWGWPLAPPPPVVARFAAPAGPYAPGHRGVDLAAPPGAAVLAAAAGVVAFAGRVAGRGVVSVDHPGGLRTTYEPVTATVHRGEQVGAGGLLGRLEALGSHCPPAACLHWGLRRGADYLDPLSLLAPVPVRLLPVWGLGPSAAGATGEMGVARAVPRAGAGGGIAAGRGAVGASGALLLGAGGALLLGAAGAAAAAVRHGRAARAGPGQSREARSPASRR